jgi:hypothetical protein
MTGAWVHLAGLARGRNLGRNFRCVDLEAEPKRLSHRERSFRRRFQLLHSRQPPPGFKLGSGVFEVRRLRPWLWRQEEKVAFHDGRGDVAEFAAVVL